MNHLVSLFYSTLIQLNLDKTPYFKQRNCCLGITEQKKDSYRKLTFCVSKKDIVRVESVQRHFTKRISGLNHLSYHERLRALNIPSLEYRRSRGDMIETYKILHTIYDKTNN